MISQARRAGRRIIPKPNGTMPYDENYHLFEGEVL